MPRIARLKSVLLREWSVFQCVHGCHTTCQHSVFTDPQVVGYH